MSFISTLLKFVQSNKGTPKVQRFSSPQPKKNVAHLHQQPRQVFGAVLFLFLFCFSAKASTPDSLVTDCCDLKILTWNIQMLPRMAFMCKNREKRAEGIINTLHDKDYDIIVFQEVFDQHTYQQLYKGLKSSYPYQTGMPIKKNFLYASSGVWIISKLPFKVMDYVFFDKSSDADFFSNKGAILIESEKNGKVFQLIGTHLQANDKPKDKWIRLCQYKQIEDSLLKPYARAGVPQFIAGDMNTPSSDSINYKQMLSTFASANDSISGNMKSTYDGLHNSMVIKSDRKLSRQIDYILVRNFPDKPISQKRRVVEFKCCWDKKYSYLSDHYALEGVFEL